jgi:hypothetical protein
MFRKALPYILTTLLLLSTGCFSGFFNGALNGTFNEPFNSVNKSFDNGTIFGGLYSHTIEPLTFNNNPTEVRESLRQARGVINQVEYPLSSVLTIRLGRNGLGDVAKRHGIETVYYADIENWSALFGLWSRDVVHIYGR